MSISLPLRSALFLAALCLPLPVLAQITVATQGFEPSDPWTYTATPPPFLNAAGDVWDVAPSVGSGSGTELILPASGERLWGVRDLNNPSGGTDAFGALVFDPVRVAGYEGLTLSFRYRVVSFDTGDALTYEVVLDGEAQGIEPLFTGATGGLSTDGWQTVEVPIPDGTLAVGLVLSAKQNGQSDWAAFDDVTLTAASGSPTTSVQFASKAYQIDEGDEGAQSVDLVVGIAYPDPNQATTVEVVVSENAPGTATAGEDYAFTPVTLTFPAGSSTPQTVSVTVFGDEAAEGDETVRFELTRVRGGDRAGAGLPGAALLTLAGDDALPLVINEIHADPDLEAGDANGDGLVDSGEDEFVEIINASAAPVDLSGFALRDAYAVRHVVPDGTILAPEGFLTIFGGGEPSGIDGAVQVASSGSLGLNNAGDLVALDDALGAEVTSVTYGREGGRDQSITRDPDVSGPFVLHTTLDGALFSPGRATGSGPLPVELVAFAARVDARVAHLGWETASEERNAGFEVQHRGPGDEHFSAVDFVAGAGTTSGPQRYTYRVPLRRPGTHAFRLRQVDVDGSVTFSSEVEVDVAVEGRFELSEVTPNPLRSRATVELAVPHGQAVEVALYNALGQRVLDLHDGPVAAGVVLRLPIDGSDLPSGLYLCRAAGETFQATRRFVVIR